MQKLADRYDLGDALGQGRSTVYRAVDTRLRREVAIKRVQLLAGQEDAEQVRTRALREAQASARLNNPAAVTVYDVVEEAGSIWLVMELVDGPSLSQVVADEGPLSHARAAAIGLGVLTALEAAHLVGVVHRDVKPANVLVSEGDRVKLTDFGVATIRDESRVTATGLIVGSPSYMSPEQATGGEITAATDLWALGAMLYYAVEGQPPFQAGTALATASAVVHGHPRPQANTGPLTPVLNRLFSKDPAGRPSAGEVRVALGRAARRRRRGRPRPGDATLVAAAPLVPATTQLTPAPVAEPEPDPQPTPEPEPRPEPQAEPTPEPERSVEQPSPASTEPVPPVASEPSPAPLPAPVAAAAAPDPQPTPEPEPRPEPQAEFEPEPEPPVELATPAPPASAATSVASEPTPEPTPEPEPEPEPDSEPSMEELLPASTGPLPSELATAPEPTPATVVGAATPEPVELPTQRREPFGSRRLVAVAAVALLVVIVAAFALRGDDDDEPSGSAAPSTTEPADDEAGDPEVSPEVTDPAETTDTTAAPTTTTDPTTTTTESGVPDGWAPYADPQGAYTIGVPPGWQVDPTGSSRRIDIRDPATGAYLRVEWTDAPRADPVADWQAQASGSSYSGYEEVGIGPATYRDYDAALWEWRHQTGGTTVHTGNLGFIADGKGFALMFRSPESEWAASQPVYEQFKQAFQPS